MRDQVGHIVSCAPTRLSFWVLGQAWTGRTRWARRGSTFSFSLVMKTARVSPQAVKPRQARRDGNRPAQAGSRTSIPKLSKKNTLLFVGRDYYRSTDT
jgi:hypothetical protein